MHSALGACGASGDKIQDHQELQVKQAIPTHGIKVSAAYERGRMEAGYFWQQEQGSGPA